MRGVRGASGIASGAKATPELSVRNDLPDTRQGEDARRTTPGNVPSYRASDRILGHDPDQALWGDSLPALSSVVSLADSIRQSSGVPFVDLDRDRGRLLALWTTNGLRQRAYALADS